MISQNSNIFEWMACTRAVVVHLNFRAGSAFPVPVCTVPGSRDRTSRCNKGDAVRLYASYLLLKGQRCVCTGNNAYSPFKMKKFLTKSTLTMYSVLSRFFLIFLFTWGSSSFITNNH